MIKSICIVRLSALGDVIMLVPLIRSLQAGLAHVRLTWIISRPAYDLVAGMDGVEFIVIDKPKSLSDYWQFKKQMRNRHFDVLLALQTTLRANLLYPLIKAKRKIGFDMPKRNDGHGLFVHEKISLKRGHNLDWFLKFAEPLGIEKLIRWDLPINQADHQWAADNLPKKGPILVVNPAASKPERSWLVDRYIAVLKQAINTWNLQIVLTGGPGNHDKELAAGILKEIPAAINLVGKTKPKQLLALISRADAILCPDTGPSHMAAAVNTPVIALHAVTNPLISGPYTFKHLAVNQYPEAQQSILGKSYEHHVWGTHVHGDGAMKLISVEAVLEKLALVFDGYSK